MRDAFEAIAREHAGQSVVVVTHGGVLATLYRHIHGIPLDVAHPIPIANASYNVLRHDAGALEHRDVERHRSPGRRGAFRGGLSAARRRHHGGVARLHARDDVVVVADVVHELHRLAAARVAVLERRDTMSGSARRAITWRTSCHLSGIELDALREDARVLEVADADVVGGEREEGPVGLLDARRELLLACSAK